MSQPRLVQSLILAAALAVSGAGTSSPANAQIPGWLPSVGDVEPSAPLPIDGMWNIREINKRVIIENGYAYAVDGWVHALFFNVMPDQVFVRDIQPLPDGTYISQNLTMSGQMTFEPAPGGSLVATMRTGWPGKWHYDPVHHGGYEPPYSDTDQDDGPYPPEDGRGADRVPPENPDAGEAPVNPWN